MMSFWISDRTNTTKTITTINTISSTTTSTRTTKTITTTNTITSTSTTMRTRPPQPSPSPALTWVRKEDGMVSFLPGWPQPPAWKWLSWFFLIRIAIVKMSSNESHHNINDHNHIIHLHGEWWWSLSSPSSSSLSSQLSPNDWYLHSEWSAPNNSWFCNYLHLRHLIVMMVILLMLMMMMLVMPMVRTTTMFWVMVRRRTVWGSFYGGQVVSGI